MFGSKRNKRTYFGVLAVAVILSLIVAACSVSGTRELGTVPEVATRVPSEVAVAEEPAEEAAEEEAAPTEAVVEESEPEAVDEPTAEPEEEATEEVVAEETAEEEAAEEEAVEEVATEEPAAEEEAVEETATEEAVEEEAAEEEVAEEAAAEDAPAEDAAPEEADTEDSAAEEAVEEEAAEEEASEEEAVAVAASPIPHPLEKFEACDGCHDPASDEMLAVNHEAMTNDVCVYCHMPEEGEAALPELPEKAETEFCLACHGPIEDLQASTADYVTEEGLSGNPHMFVPHDSTTVFACSNCHDVHELPVTDPGAIESGDLNYCFAACHHERNFEPCTSCH